MGLLPRGRPLLWTLLFAPALGVVVLEACQDELPTTYALDAPRILAIRSNPIDLAPDAAVTLDALIYTPPGAPAPTYTWSWCATVDSTFTCTRTAASLQATLDPDGTKGVSINYALGSGNTATFALPIGADVILAACEARRGPQDAGDAGDDDAGDDDAGVAAVTGITDGGGLPCANGSVDVDVLLSVVVGGTTLRAARTLTIDLDGSVPNTNPIVLGIDAGLVGSDVFGLGAEIPTSAADTYTRAIPQGFDPNADAGDDDDDAGDAGIATFTESLNLAWYAQGGIFQRATTTLPASQNGAPLSWDAGLLNTWTAPGNGTYTLILVARDNRGGVGWFVGPVVAP